MISRFFRQMRFVICSWFVAEQIDSFRDSVSMSFFNVVIDLITDWQGANTDEERLVYLRAVRDALDKVPVDCLPADVLEWRIMDKNESHLL